MRTISRKGPRTLLFWVPLLIGGLLTAIVSVLLHYQNTSSIRSHVNQMTQEVESSVQSRFQQYTYGLRGARGAVIAAGGENISRAQFINYINSRDLEEEFPGALGFGFIRRVPIQEEAQYVARVRQDGDPDFNVKTLTPHTDDRFVIQYIFPEAPNQQAIGLDIGSESNRRQAAMSAARENRAFLTAPITLVQADKKSRKGVLILLPVYRNDQPHNTPELREQNVVGWSYAPLVIDDVLANLENVFSGSKITLTNLSEQQPFFESSDQFATYLQENTASKTLTVMGQRWQLEVSPSADLVKHLTTNIQAVAFLGGLLSLLGSILIGLYHYKLEQKSNDLDSSQRTDFATYTKTANAKKSVLPTFFGLLLMYCFVSAFIIEKDTRAIKNSLQAENKAILERIKSATEKYTEDTLFIAHTPSTSELITGNTINQASINIISDIFRAYMLTSPEVFQIRLITKQTDWSEQVKIERKNGVLTRYDDSDLQNKKNEPYVTKSMNLDQDRVYLSEINLNREYGVIEYPPHPVWRFSTPAFSSDGERYGIIVINIHANNLLDFNSQGPNHNIYITNSNGQYLVHPESSMEFAFERGSSDTWQSDFQPSSSWLNIPGLLAYSGPNGVVWAMKSDFAYDEENTLSIYTTYNKMAALSNIVWKLLGCLVITMTIFMAFIAFHYWLWRNEIIQRNNEWNEKLNKQREKEAFRFKELIESSPEATLITDANGVIKMVNAEAETAFGYPRSQLEGSSVNMLIPAQYHGAHPSNIKDFLENATGKSKNVRMRGPKNLHAIDAHGKEFPVEISLSAVDMGDEVLISATIRNISERLAFEQELKQALQDAEKATHAKSAFLANTSHEIRTPLNAIIGLTHLLLNEPITESQRQLVKKISLSGNALLNIVNDVLDLSKIEANEMSLENIPVDLVDFLDEISSVYSVQAEVKGIHFNLSLASDLPRWVITDSNRLRQIITNLISNALKFTKVGGIDLITERVSEVTDDKGETTATIRITVRDTGIGISEEAQDRLFKPFSQADSSTSRKYGGTGLGLSIIKKLVDMMGGTVGVISQEGHGSAFWLEVPCKVMPDNDANLATQNQQRSLYVVIAEDNQDDANHVKKLAQSLGWRTDLVEDGLQLLETLQERLVKGLRMPDALVVDWKMPNLDGLSAVQQLDQLMHDHADHLPVVLMLSAYDAKEIEAATIDQPNLIHSILKKPINGSKLFNSVNEAVSCLTDDSNIVLEASVTEGMHVNWLPGVKVLIVDDSDINLEVAKHLLTQSGAEVDTANSALLAIEKLQQPLGHYDAILMDVQMPEMDGLEATRFIRQELNLTSLPIIALTAGALVEERMNALQAGMDDFLTKPIDPSHLISVLRRRVSQSQGITLGIEEKDKVKNANLDDDWPEIAGLNGAHSSQLLMGNKELFFITLEHLLKDNQNLLEQSFDDIDTAQPSADRLELAAQIHKLRSSSGMVGAESLHQLASQAEKALREPDQQVRDLMLNLTTQLQQLKLNATPAISLWQDEANSAMAAASSDETLSQEALDHLRELLEKQDLSVLDISEKQKAGLFGYLGREKYPLFDEAIKRLNFKDAKQLLESTDSDGA